MDQPIRLKRKHKHKKHQLALFAIKQSSQSNTLSVWDTKTRQTFNGFMELDFVFVSFRSSKQIFVAIVVG